MTVSGRADRPTPRWQVALLVAVLVALLSLRLWFHLAVSPMGDEAYYWMWGQHLAWSYFDHPPLQAWLLSGIAAIVGWSNLSVRLLTWLTTAGTLFVFWLWSARLASGDRLGWFLATSVIYLCVPGLAIMTGIAFQDHLLLFFVTAAGYTFFIFCTDYEAGTPRWRWLYGTALLLGLALLSKYNGVFLVAGLGLTLLLRRSLRPLLLTRHLWLGLALILALQAPVIWWNLTEGLASFRFHLLERPRLTSGGLHVEQLTTFLEVAAFTMSPLLLIGLIRLPWLWRSWPAETRRAAAPALVTFATSTLGWSVLALFVAVYFHWNIVAYAALAPIGWRLVGGRLGLALHVLLGLAVATIWTLNYTLLPHGVFGFRDAGAPANYGWPEVAAQVSSLQSQHPDAFLAATRYTYAAQLGFALHRTDVTAFNPVPSENSFWWDPASHAGRDALILADRQFRISNAAAAFQSVEKLATIEVAAPLGDRAWTFDIWLGHGYMATPGPLAPAEKSGMPSASGIPGAP